MISICLCCASTCFLIVSRLVVPVSTAAAATLLASSRR